MTRPRTRWEVRVHSYNVLAGEFDVDHAVRTYVYRWRWYASLQCLLWNTSPSVAGVRLWATLHRVQPKLQVVAPINHNGPAPTGARPTPYAPPPPPSEVLR